MTVRGFLGVRTGRPVRGLIGGLAVGALVMSGSSVALADEVDPVPVESSLALEGTGQDPELSALQRALEEAAETGEPVELLSKRGESREVFAMPDGTVQENSYAVPHWARTDEGWTQVDTDLAVEDGAIQPVASTVGLEFSAGGDDALVRMSRHGRAVELT